MTDPNKITAEQIQSATDLDQIKAESKESRPDPNSLATKSSEVKSELDGVATESSNSLNGLSTSPIATTHSSDTDPQDVTVLIIGAGITGLLIAHGLKKAGIRYRIFESEPSASHYRPREWSMAIHWSLSHLEALLPEHLVARLDEAKNDPTYKTREDDVMPVVHGVTGEVMRNIPIGRAIRVSRRKMRAFCSNEIDVEYGKTLESIDFETVGNKVKAKFTNGEEVVGDVIIGTDGPKSAVRNCLLGPEQGATTPLKVVHVNTALCYNDADKARFIRSCHPIFSLCVHPKGISFLAIQDVPDPDKPETWRFQVVVGWLGEGDQSLDNAGRLAQLKEKTSDFAEPFRSAVQWMPDDTPLTYDNINYWVPIPWDSREGRGTLAGDAAHPMAPHRGQGLNHAICDAEAFVGTITKVKTGKATLREAVTTYTDKMLPRTTDEVLSSRENAFMIMSWDRVKESALMKGGLQKNRD